VSGATEIDEIDVKILRALIRDARESRKAIARECGISATAVTKRIEQLKNAGIIIGARLIAREDGYPLVADIEAKADYAWKPEIVKSIREQLHITGCYQCIGQYDIAVGIFANNARELDEAVQFIKNLRGVNRVFVNTWLGKPVNTLQNIVLQPKRAQHA
jgi:DNA-binding Lrp family transcriptional regulator